MESSEVVDVAADVSKLLFVGNEVTILNWETVLWLVGIEFFSIGGGKMRDYYWKRGRCREYGNKGDRSLSRGLDFKEIKGSRGIRTRVKERMTEMVIFNTYIQWIREEWAKGIDILPLLSYIEYKRVNKLFINSDKTYSPWLLSCLLFRMGGTRIPWM